MSAAAVELVDEWATTLTGNIHALLTATPARVPLFDLVVVADALGTTLPRLMSPDFDVSEVPWLPCLELVEG